MLIKPKQLTRKWGTNLIFIYFCTEQVAVQSYLFSFHRFASIVLGEVFRLPCRDFNPIF
jgi:hypothetical protein